MNDAFGNPQSILLLGGTSEIGMAIVRRLTSPALRSAVLAGRDEDRLAPRAAQLRAAGAPQVTTVVFRADEPAQAGDVIDECLEGIGGDLDLVVMALGDLGDERHREFDPAATAHTLGVNFAWPAAALSALGERLQRQGHGQIVVMSSVAGVRVRRSNYVYGSAKAGLDGYARGLAESLRPSGVQVLVVRPGFVRTKMTTGLSPAPFSVDPDDVAVAVGRALETAKTSGIVWVPGVLRWVFLVLGHLPQSIWRRLPG